MPPRPFLIRLMFPFAVMMLIIIVVCGALMHWTGQRTVRLQQQQDARQVAEMIERWNMASAGELFPERQTRLTQMAAVLSSRLTLIDDAGDIVFDTHVDPETHPSEAANPEIAEARHKGIGVAVYRSDLLNDRAAHTAIALTHPDGWIVRLSSPAPQWDRLGLPGWVVLGIATLLALLIVGVMAFLLQSRWVTPLQVLSQCAEQMAAGQWHVRMPQIGSDDLKYFSTRLNRVATQAEKQLNDLKQQRSDLQALVNTLPDPIIVTDADERITLVNVPAARLLELAPEQALGRKLVSVVNESAILELYEKTARGAGAQGPHSEEPGPAREIRIVRDGARSTYQGVARPTTAGGVLLVLRNVSTMSAAIQMKTDFVANASHELRTPIAAIKIAFETLRDVHGEDPVQTERCITIIDGHLKRLEEMLRDLLDLSRVENQDLKPHIAHVRLDEIFATLRAGLGPMARQKNIDLVLEDRREGQHPFFSDVRLLNLVLKNLVENSIKFTPSGGKVTVGVEQSAVGGAVRITVADTGTGIAPEHIDRVFERFYQADPARSGSAGRGTGLGLAIVKHAIAGLGGTVQLRSTVGVGTTVTCTLPQPRDTDAAAPEDRPHTAMA